MDICKAYYFFVNLAGDFFTGFFMRTHQLH